MSRKPQTTVFRRAIVAEWNKGERSMTEIGAMFGKPRTTIGRYLREARLMGWSVLAVDLRTAAIRCRVALRRNLGDAEFQVQFAAKAAHMRAAKKARQMTE